MKTANTGSFVHLPSPKYNGIFVCCATLHEALRYCPDAIYAFATDDGYWLFTEESEAYYYAYNTGQLDNYYRQYNQGMFSLY